MDYQLNFSMLHGACPLCRKLVESQLLLDSKLVEAAGAWLSLQEAVPASKARAQRSLLRHRQHRCRGRARCRLPICALKEQLVDATALSRFNDQHDFNLTEEAMSFVCARLEEAGLGFRTWTDSPPRTAARSRASTPFLATEGKVVVYAFAQSIVG